MDDYINREEAIKALYEVYEYEYPTASGDFDEYARHDVRNVLNGLPSADVQPVKHGHWIEHPDDIFPLESTIECSVCGEQENVNIHNDNYCPNCGAKMNLMAGDSDD